MKEVKNKLTFLLKEEILLQIGLIVTSFCNVLALLFAAHSYFTGSIDNAIFWAVMLVSSEVGYVGLKLEKSKKVNMTLDLSNVKATDEMIKKIKKSLETHKGDKLETVCSKNS